MTVSSISSTPNVLTILAAASQAATQLSVQVTVDQTTSQLEKQLKQKIAALPNAIDNTAIKTAQSQLNFTKERFNIIATRSSQFGANGNTLTDINKQLAALHTAIANGDGTTFDLRMSATENDIGNLILAPPTPPFQADQILPLKTQGLNIRTSGSYDLTTAAGRSAATSDVNTAQQYINQLLALTTSNQVVASSVATALSSQIDSLNQTLTQTTISAQLHATTETARLTQLAHNQEHLIQLALGNTTQLATALAKMAATPDPSTSPFQTLLSLVGATADSVTPAQTSNAILSLLA